METNTESYPVDYQPVWWAKGPHAQTILGSLTNHPKSPLLSRHLEVRLDDDNALSLIEDKPRSNSRQGVALLLHGLGGDAASSYMLSTSWALTHRGWTVYRLNHRGAGSGVGLSTKMYNSGISQDLPRVFETISDLQPGVPTIAVGYSMSGNILLKYLAELGNSTPVELKGAISVNPAVDLNACVFRLEQPENRIYHKRFLRLLMQQRRVNAQRMGIQLDKIRPRGLREFDELFTAPSWGFSSAEDYYTKSSAAPLLPQIKVPTIILTAKDDPIVPLDSLQVPLSPSCNFHLAQAGGHMGYLSRRKTPLGNRRWLDWNIQQLAERLIEESSRT